MKEEGGEGVILGAGGMETGNGFFIFFFIFFNLGGFVSFLGGQSINCGIWAVWPWWYGFIMRWRER